MPFLLASNGPEAGKIYELSDGDNILGRHPDCSIVIDVGAVSRHHCKVTIRGSLAFIEDMYARNGTFVNEALVPPPQRKPLRHGDQIRVCDVIFHFHADGAPLSTTTEESGISAVVIDDMADSSSSTIMSKLDVVSDRGHSRLAASPEAKLDALIEITNSLGRALALDDVLSHILDSLFRIFHQADRGFIGLIDDGGRLVPRWTKLRRESNDDTIRVSLTIANQVMKTKQAILSADAVNDSRFQMSESIADYRIRSMMCAPLIDSDGKVMGILQIDTVNQGQRFTESDLALLVATASQASIAIDNARLHEEAVQNRTLERELQLARDVQSAFLPSREPATPGYDFFHYYRAAHQIGGDYFDYIELPDGRLAVIVADVVGHGIAAAMLMAKLSAEVRFCLASEPDAVIAATRLNTRLLGMNLNRFVTFISVTLDPTTNQVKIVNAGHPPPIYRKPDGSVELPSRSTSGLPLGILDRGYELCTIDLQLGESLTLFTDGIDEAMSSDGKQFSIERMTELVSQSSGSPAEIGESILQSVREHMGDHQQDDDMCLVCLRRMPV